MNIVSICTGKSIDAMKIRTREMGSRFKFGGVTYEVAEPTGEGCACWECAFYDGSRCGDIVPIDVLGLCFRGMRSDDRQAIFKRCDDEEKIDSLLNGDFTNETTEEWE